MSQLLTMKVTLVAGVFLALSPSHLMAAQQVSPMADVAETRTPPVLSTTSLEAPQLQTETPPSPEWKRQPAGVAIQGATAAVLSLAAPGIDPAIITTIAGNVYGILHTQGPVRLALMGTLLYQLSINEHTSHLINNVVRTVTPAPVYAAWNQGVSLFKTLYPVHQEIIKVVNSQENSVQQMKIAKVDAEAQKTPQETLDLPA